MPYVGNPLADAYSARVKQDLTGGSGTSFTLSHAVSSPNDLSIYINHVRQEPTTAYTVNGTALTMTGSVAGTDDFYIIYDELALQSISHPANQALTATAGTFTSGLVGTTGTFSGALSATTGTFSGALSAKGGAVFNEDSADVDFRVESNGQANMFVVNGGTDRIGIMTNSPDANHAVHIQSGGYRSNDADSIGLLIGADIGATTFSDSTRKIGGISFAHYDTDEPNFNAIRCDSQSGTSVLTIGGTGETNAVETIQFNTASDDTNVSTMAERMKINAAGKVQIGSTNTAGRLNINFDHSGGEVGIELIPNATTATMLNFKNAGGVGVGSITSSGSSTAFNTSSDYRLKENVNYSWDATSRLKQLKPARFNFKADADTTVDGFLAHEVSSIIPEAISGEKDATEKYTDEDGKEQTRNVYQGIDQSKLVPLLVKVIQELEARIKALENK